MGLNIGTPKTHHFPFGTNENVVVLAVPILKHFRVCYSRTLVAQTLLAHLPWLFQTHSKVLNKNDPIAADIIVFGIISGNYLFYTDNGMLCILIRITSMRRF